MAFTKYTYLKGLHGLKMPSDTYYRVLVTLLDYANKDGTRAFPGNEQLAKDCACSVDTVKRALNWAKAQGLVNLDKRGRHNSGASEWSFPQQCTAAPLSAVHKGAGEPLSAGLQHCTGAPPPKEDQYTEVSLSSDVPVGEPDGSSGGRDLRGKDAAVSSGLSSKMASQSEDPWTSPMARSTGEHPPALIRSTNHEAAAEDPWGPPVGARMEAAPPW